MKVALRKTPTMLALKLELGRALADEATWHRVLKTALKSGHREQAGDARAREMQAQQRVSEYEYRLFSDRIKSDGTESYTSPDE